MLLSQLAEVSGVPPATIKYYRREGLLPAGERITTTRQDYGRTHLERLALIQVLREIAGAPIARIAQLTAILDDPEQPLLSALAASQHIALGIPGPEEGTDDQPRDREEHPSIAPLLAHLGWPDAQTAPRRALDELLHSLEGWEMPTDLELLRRYAEPVARIARDDVDAIRKLDGEAPGEPVGEDVQVMRAVAGAIAFDRLIQLLRALGHTSYSILRAGQERPGPDPENS